MADPDSIQIQVVRNLNPYKRVGGIVKIEHFFRVAASVDIDKADVKRYYDFVDHKVSDLLLMGEAAASANGRDIVEPWDLPITKGLQESIHVFERLDVDIGLEPILDKKAPRPADLDRPYSLETDARLPTIAGGVSVALARSFKIIDPEIKHPATEDWERAFQIFDQLL
ncbi:DUF1931 family protein [Candidatus Binatus sp.]|uniref:DUF1931 family protein n=1 Tax=Candidatus Binatus sp. TaxID=2811406 RepID=UPI003BAEB588